MTTIASVVSEIICLIKIRADGRQTDRQTYGNGGPVSLYPRGYERSKKRKSRESVDGLDYNIRLVWEIICLTII